jgi:hypothetical protein
VAHRARWGVQLQVSTRRKGRTKTAGRTTPSPKTLPVHVAAAGADRRRQANLELAKPVLQHLERHGTWKGVLHGFRVTIVRDPATGAITHTNHGKAGR